MTPDDAARLARQQRYTETEAEAARRRDRLMTAPTMEDACAEIRDAGISIGPLYREHEGFKAWGYDWSEDGDGGNLEAYLGAEDLRLLERAFRTLAEHTEAAAARLDKEKP